MHEQPRQRHRSGGEANHIRPRYGRPDELYCEALELLADRLAWAARRGDVLAWTWARCWAEVALAWWCEVER